MVTEYLWECKVIRDGELVEIPSEEIVLGDCIQTEEGTFIPADGIIIQSNDFSINESILTGESLAAFKNENSENNTVFQGTIVASDDIIGNFVTKMSLIGLIVFAIVWGVNYYNSRILLDSLLKALTLAMSIIPEEIPVAFATFMALGAWRLMKTGIIANIKEVFETFYKAGIQVKIVTGDNALTTATIANQIGFRNSGEI
uniref:P-type Ca(2+) transporter n=1 Tax=Hucho hucho TaxID=62062 RepID=A0A4W5LCN7_9TELE